MAFQFRDKIFFLFSTLVIVFSTLSYYSSLPSDPARCDILLNKGFWLRPAQLLDWQPSGCRLYNYDAREAATCLGERRVVMVGGTSMLTMYEAFVKILNPDYRLPFLKDGQDVATTARHVSLEFFWDPNLDGTELQRIRAGSTDNATRPILTVLGLERDNVKQNKDVTAWTAHIDNLLSDFRAGPQGVERLTDSVILTPLLEPNIPRLSPSPIDMLNDVLASLAKKYGVQVAFTFNDVIGPKNALIDAKFVVEKANDVMASILVNHRCNALWPSEYPFAGVCCNSYPGPTWVQKLGIASILLLLFITPVAMYLDRRGFSADSSTIMRYMPAHKYSGAILTLIGGTALCWYLDRTNVFGKEAKGWNMAQFLFVVISASLSLVGLQPADKKESSLAYRGQADEWKGILQMAILVYRYCDYSSTDYIYIAYLFITGCETAISHLRDPESFTAKKIASTVLRFNLLRIVLALATSRDSRLYFFPIVITVNYLITLAIFIPMRHKNANDVFLTCKIAGAAFLTALVYHVPPLIGMVAVFMQAVFHVPGDAWEWRDRLMQQPFAVFFGIAAGFAYVKASQQFSSVVQLRPSSPIRRVTQMATDFINNKYTGWVGRGWLETFLLQFHVWLAADSTGLLMVGLIPASQRLINVFVTTPMFFYISWAVTNAVYGVVEWIMGPDATRGEHIAVPTTDADAEDAPFTKITDDDGDRPNAEGLGISKAEEEEDETFVEKDLNRLEKGPVEGMPTGRRASTVVLPGQDWRVRVGALVAVAAVLSWTYYL